MTFKRLIKKIEKVLGRDLKFSLREFRQLELLQKDITFLKVVLQQATEEKNVPLLVTYYQKRVRKDERVVQRIERRLNVWLQKLDTVLERADKAEVTAREMVYLRLWKQKLDICKNNLVRLLSRGGELDLLLQQPSPPWQEIKEKIEQAMGSNKSPGLRALVAVVEEFAGMKEQLKGKEKEIATLRELLRKKGEPSFVRRKAIVQLAELGDKQSIPLFREYVRPIFTSDVRTAAIRALASLDPQGSISLFKEIVENFSRKEDSFDSIERSLESIVLQETIYALARINSPEAKKLLVGFTQDSNALVSSDAKSALYASTGELKYHPLYRQQQDFFEDSNVGKFKRKEFFKTGSGTTLLGGVFKGKVIIRVISESCFLAWKRALEAEEAWRKAGFDYIPVEPILRKGKALRAYPAKERLIRVYTQVLGPTLKNFISLHPEYKQKLSAVADKIEYILKYLGITHGHLHFDNFCVEMQQGKPRVYVIDFDRAVLEEKSKMAA